MNIAVALTCIYILYENYNAIAILEWLFGADSGMMSMLYMPKLTEQREKMHQVPKQVVWKPNMLSLHAQFKILFPDLFHSAPILEKEFKQKWMQEFLVAHFLLPD